MKHIDKKLSSLGLAAAIMGGLAMSGGFDPSNGMPMPTHILTEAERKWLLSLDAGGRKIWGRRFDKGLSPSERKFVDEKLADLKEAGHEIAP